MAQTGNTGLFEIEDGILTAYHGRQKNVVIPEGVTEIGRWAFSDRSSLQSVSIPSGVKKIGYAAFADCRNLTDVRIPETVEIIENKAFSGCDSLTGMTLPQNISVSDQAFQGCKGLADSEGFIIMGSILFEYCGDTADVMVPKSVRILGNKAFEGHSGMKTVLLPENLEEIGNSAFENCSGLTGISIPQSVKKIGNWAFSGCSGLTSISIPESVTEIGSYAFSGCSSLTNMSIPESVKILCDGAFSDCASLESIVLPDSLSCIEGYQFRNCKRLKTIKLPKGIIALHEALFYGCKSLLELEIPEGVISIGEEAFKNCSSLKKLSLPRSLRTVEQNAFGSEFGRAINLQEVCVTDLNSWCGIQFKNKEANPVFFSHRLLLNGSPVTELLLKDAVQRILPYSFVCCKTLKSVKLPVGLKSIGEGAFQDCDSLTEVSLPDGLERIGVSAFAGCKNLRSVDIPKSVKSIECDAFSGCSRITEVRIPASVTDIDRGAFSNCRFLNGIRVDPDNPCYCGDPSGVLFNRTMTVLLAAPGTLSGSYTIPAGVNSIMAGAFSGCSRLKTLSIPDSAKNIEWGALRDIQEFRIREWSDMLTYAVDEKIITAIYTDDLQKVPTNLKRAAISGFLLDDVDKKSARFRSHRAYLTGHMEKLRPYFFEHPELLYALCEKQLLLAKNVDEFMEEAERKKNTEIKALLLNYQQTLGSEKMEKARTAKEKAKQDYADGLIQRLSERDLAKGINGLTFVVTGSLRKWENRDEIKEWLGQYGACLGGSITRKTDYLVTNDPNSGTEKNMKAKAVGALVISEEEFNHMVGWHYRDEESITVPEWLTSIPAGAFLGNKNTKTVVIPESITRIGTGAFAYCESLEKINIPKSVIWIDRFAFRGCKGLADQNGFVVIRDVLYDYFGNERVAAIPDEVVRIQEGAFHNHSDGELYLSVRGFPFRADRGIYQDSSKLERVVIPESVKWIEDRAFQCCKGISAVIMPEGVANIGESAFAGCGALREITIPGSVKSIGERAFSGCTGLETLVVSEGVERLEKEAFLGCSNLKTVDLPASITAFENNALPNDHVFIVRTVKNSHAMKYAKRRKLNIELV